MSVYEEIFKKHGFSKTQQKILSLVGKKKEVLEIGAATGYMTKAFLDNDCIVDVVETNNVSLRKISKRVREKINYSIEDENINIHLSKNYDFIIMADVLEHLVDPSKALKILYKIAQQQTRLIISLPNIASWPMRKQLFFKGDFEYQDSGLLDKTHLHFYTVNTLPKFLTSTGWRVEEIIGTITRLPFEETLSKIPVLGWIFKRLLYSYLVENYKNLSYYHFLVVANK